VNFTRKIIYCSCLLLLFCEAAWSKHIKGGEIHYQYLGPGSAPNSDKYSIRLRLFIACNSTQGQLETSVNLSIYRNADNTAAAGSPFTAELNYGRMLYLTKPSPCILNPSPVCYWVREFITTVELPKEALGYTIIFQRCCRIDQITNLRPNINVGASYTCQIQGTNTIGLTASNSNPDFGIKDTALICQKHRFTLNYSATDSDNDSLSYEFSPGYYGGSANNAIVTNPPGPQYLTFLQYSPGFSGAQPLGPDVTIDRRTGVISGLAPAAGDYVVCVLLKEYRNGLVISAHRKDFIIHVDDKCDFPSASLAPSYITCDGFNFDFENQSPPTPLIHSYYWDFGVPGSSTDTTSAQSPVFTFPDTGTFQVKLLVNKGEQCSDSASTLMKVYPGFFPGFTTNGACVLNPVKFTDTTKTRYGLVSSWSWNFGDPGSATDTSSLQNPSWKYSDTGAKNVQFIVSNSKGCLDTVNENISVTGKPILTLPFHDTLICDIDTLALHAVGEGVFTWTPGPDLLKSNSPDPLVYPKTTTTYNVNLNQDGCINNDSVTVHVVDKVTLSAGNDSTICLGDTIRLNPSGDALYFAWTPAAALDNSSLKNPATSPAATTHYDVTGSIGKCTAQSGVTIRTVPYPLSRVSNDTSICYGDTAQLAGTMNGIKYVWTPAATLSSTSTLDPLAFPLQTTTYFLYVYDTLGCPKPGIASVQVHVEDKIYAFAGNDTSVVVGQPLQLNASGAPSFLWYPSTGLNRNDISNPVATLDNNIEYVVRAYTEEGCFALDTISVKVFKTAPDIFVPNAFTPGKAINAVFRPIPVGISAIEFFRIYNRNGMLIYSTSRLGSGWDGTYNGKPQDSGGFVWTVKGVDYTGKVIAKQGTMVLIR
jgi:gliding motility-associated-like protein